MKLDDAVFGVLIALFGVAVVTVASNYHSLRHISYGPGFFPTLVGSGLIVCGALMIARRITTDGLRGSRWITPGPWIRSPSLMIGFALIPVSTLVYILVVDRLGFFLSMATLLSFQIAWFTRRPLRAMTVALLVCVAIQEFFQGFMSVPLPWGILQPLAEALTWM